MFSLPGISAKGLDIFLKKIYRNNTVDYRYDTVSYRNDTVNYQIRLLVNQGYYYNIQVRLLVNQGE